MTRTDDDPTPREAAATTDGTTGSADAVRHGAITGAMSSESSNDGRLWRVARLIVLIAAIVALGVTQGAGMLIVVGAIVVIIFMHELGHFLMARRAGMLATEFFIGFGPKIFSFRRGETEYGLKVIPAGAYVRIVGMSSLEEVDPALESRTYRQGRFRDRMGVAVAGSAMHFIMAFALLLSLYSFVGTPRDDIWEVRSVTPGSAAEDAGIRAGDRLVELNGEPVSDFEHFRDQLAGVAPGQAVFTVDRDGTRVELPATLSKRSKVIGTVGEDLDIMDNGAGPVVVEPTPDGVVANSGLAVGDRVIAIDGHPIDSLDDIAGSLPTSGGLVSVTVADAAGVESVHDVDLGSAVDAVAPAAFLGVGEGTVFERQGPVSVVSDAALTFGRVAKASVVGVAKFLWPPNVVRFVTDTVTGNEVTDRADTPTPAESTPLGAEANRPISIIGVALIGSDLTTEGIANLLEFLALINVFFGVFNLFPMLPFDGGHVVIAIYEKIRETMNGSKTRYMSDVSRLAPVAYALVGLLVVVGLLAMFLDITKGVSL